MTTTAPGPVDTRDSLSPTPTAQDALGRVTPTMRDAVIAAIDRERTLTEPTRLRTYECDAITGHRVVPALVALPETTEEVAAVVRICADYGVPFVARGAGTGLSGGALPVADGVVISLARMRRILDINAADQRMEVEPGVTNADISRAVAHLDLYFAPDPSSQTVCTIGGNVAENSGGAHCLKYGFTTNHIYALTVGTTCVADSTPAIITLTSTAAGGAVTSPFSTDPGPPTPALLAATRLIFAVAPALRTTKPIVTDATADLAVSADQVESGAVNGGTKVRVYSDPLITQWSTGVTAKLGGVALTSVVIPASAAATATAPAIVNPAAMGNYFTAIVPAMAAATNLSLEVTNASVTVTLPTSFDIAGQSITVTPAFGPSSGLTPITIAGKFGSGFAATTVEICGVPATYVSTGSTATSVKFLTPPIATTTAAGKACDVVVAAGADPVASPVSIKTSGSTFTYNPN